MRTRSRTLTATLAAVVTAVVVGCVPATAHAATTRTTATEARAELSELDVADPDTSVAYRRADWGPWTHHHGCTTRAVVLARDAVPGTLVLGPGCRVLAGEWVSPYDRHLITDPAGVQIDHLVPVAKAAMTGGADWTRAQRVAFYNDPANLVAVSGQANDAKGDQDPGTWRPPNRADWCDYAAGYIATKHTYGLTVDEPERAALVRMLDTCPVGGGR